MFIDFPENFPPARLFRPARLMFLKNFPTCTFRIFRRTRLFGTLDYLVKIKVLLYTFNILSNNQLLSYNSLPFLLVSKYVLVYVNTRSLVFNL